jgi:hypothetical protein
MGTLCAELDKTEGGRDRDAAAVTALIIDWAERQFRQLGARDARDLAVGLFAGIQGAALLANTFRDPALLARQTRHLERSIDTLGSAQICDEFSSRDQSLATRHTRKGRRPMSSARMVITIDHRRYRRDGLTPC